MSNLREHTRELPQLQVGDKVFVQNQVGGAPTKWDLTGTVKEVRQFDQYVIKLDHSGNETLMNRKYLRLWNIPHSMQVHSSIPCSTPKPVMQHITPPVPNVSKSIAVESIEPPTNDVTPTPLNIPEEVLTNQEEQHIRPQRIRKMPDRLHYDKLGNPS